jgi:hypothetical protein
MCESMTNAPFGPLSFGIENLDMNDGIRPFAQE